MRRLAETILVVDDEQPIADIIRYNLEREGFRVVVAGDGREAVERALAELPALVVLDVMLPGLDGFEVCRELRRRTSVPILMLTAREAESDKVLGLELGADDYVTKPFSPRELVARVKALLRRSQGNLATADAHRLYFGDLVLDLDACTVYRGERPVELTAREFELLRYLARNPGKVFTREVLLRDVWGYQYPGDVRTVDVAIRRLREKIEDDPSDPRFVLTKRGVGYYFRRV